MQNDSRPISIEGCNLVTLDERGIVRNQTVTIKGGRIARIDDAARYEPVPDALVIDGRGNYLMAGLVDMHVHIGLPLLEARSESAAADLYQDAAAEGQLYLDCGITTVRNMAGAAFHSRLALEFERALRPGPRLFSSSPMLDGEIPVWSFGHPVTTQQEAREAIVAAVREGFDFIKVYNLLSRDAYAWVCDEAKAAGLPVVGHVPFDVGIIGALSAKQSSIEHLRGYDILEGSNPYDLDWVERAKTWLHLRPDKLEFYRAATADAGTWNCTTFTVMKSAIRALRGFVDQRLPSGIPPSLALRMSNYRRTRPQLELSRVLERSLLVQFEFARTLYRSNGRLLIGTDAGINDIVPGQSLLDELATFVEMGLSPTEALSVCTRGAAEYLGIEDGTGSVAVGSRADLVLLKGDPTADIRNTRRVEATFVAGRHYQVSADTVA